MGKTHETTLMHTISRDKTITRPRNVQALMRTHAQAFADFVASSQHLNIFFGGLRERTLTHIKTPPQGSTKTACQSILPTDDTRGDVRQIKVKAILLKADLLL
jgi:hypothetical protein